MKLNLASIVFLAALVMPLRTVASEVTSVTPHCKRGLKEGKGGYAVLVSCEDALGVYLGVLRTEPIGQPKLGGWTLNDRYWSEMNWGSNVTSFVWDKGGHRLWVATAGVYGVPGVYDLDLKSRTSNVLISIKAKGDTEEISFQIKKLDEEKHKLIVEEDISGAKKTLELDFAKRGA